MSKNKLKSFLKTVLINDPDSIEAAIAREVLNHYDADIVSFFRDLLRHGCQSGMVGSLIYYCDTHAFYDKHYNEIETLRIELEEDFGQPLKINGDLKNWFAWLAFEEVARKLADRFELDY